jgi:uncharacterized protein YcbX
MTDGKIAGLWRFPVKGIGREALPEVTLTPGAPLPGDRAWALLHKGAPDQDGWQKRRNFLVVAHGPRLAQVTAETQGAQLTLRHPDRAPLTFAPATEGDRLIDWVAPLWPNAQNAPHRLVQAPKQGMGDHDGPFLSILNHASRRALSQRIGEDLAAERFRGNIWLDGLGPWEEFEWIGKTIQLGGATLEVTERIERCRATEANPMTGTYDAQVPAALHSGWGHTDFGVLARVVSGGRVAIGDPAGRA